MAELGEEELEYDEFDADDECDELWDNFGKGGVPGPDATPSRLNDVLIERGEGRLESPFRSA